MLMYLYNILMGTFVKKLIFICVCTHDVSLLRALLIRWAMLETF